MSLRTRLLALFAALAVVPLISLGVFDYVRSKHDVDELIASQTAPIAERAAERAAERYEIARGDLRMIAASSDALDLVMRHERNALPTPFLGNVWRVIDTSYAWVSIRDAAGHEVEHFAADSTPNYDAIELAPLRRLVLVNVPVTAADGRVRGAVIAALRGEILAGTGTLDTRFGRAGYTAIVDSTGNVIAHASPFAGGEVVPALAGRTASPQMQTVRYQTNDTTWIASVATIRGAPLAVVAAGAVPEFAPSFARIRLVNLLLALSLAAVLVIAFIIVTRRITRPLETLTAAATEIGAGNFSPALPRTGRDEVGRLTNAFSTMSEHVQRMMRELEQSRQMAAVGSFARQIAHEIRNPLTAIKLNLQSLDRDARDGAVPHENRRTVEICLEEIQRLDRVVRGVLTLGRSGAADRRAVSLAHVVEHALDVVRPQLTAQGIDVVYRAPTSPVVVDAQSEPLAGVFLNLFLNAAEAMPSGGRLEVAIEDGDAARVIVRDSGPGVPLESRARIFEPFYSTKAQGSGLGLAVAARDVEQHRGRLLLDEPNGRTGATFIVELPAARTDA